MTPDDPRHGTHAGWSRHRADGEIPCEPCREAWNAYRLRYMKERALGYARTVSVTHGGAWQRIDAMRNEGQTYAAIAAALGLQDNHVYRLHVGIIKSVTPETWRKIMARDIDTAALTGPTHVGTVRRARALAAIGWPGVDIQHEAGLAKKTVVRLLRGDLVTTEHATRRAIADVYDRLWATRPERSKHTVRAERRAAREGWAPPMAWDNVDDPRERPKLGRRDPGAEVDHATVERVLAGEWLPTTKLEKDVIVRRWKASGKSERSLCERMGWKDGRYAREDVPA